MKTLAISAALVALAFTTSGLAATPSNLFGFAGSYSGTATLTGITSAAGPAFAIVSSSSTKNNGTIRLASSVSVPGSAIAITEEISVRSRSFSFFEALATTQIVGSGRAVVSKKKISYTGSASVGGTPFSVAGTIRRTRNGLLINEVLTDGGTTINLSYSLKRLK